MPDTPIERRRFQRIPSNLSARFLVADCWLDCTVVNISGSGAWLRTLTRPRLGSGAVLHASGLGTLSGIITRQNDLGISMKFGIKDSKKQWITEQLAHRHNGQAATLGTAIN